jgi:hypothetical protein
MGMGFSWLRIGGLLWAQQWIAGFLDQFSYYYLLIERLNFGNSITLNVRHTFFTFFPFEKLRRDLNSRKYSPVLQTVHEVAWKEPNVNAFGVSSSHIITPPHPPLTLSQPSQTFTSVIARHSYSSGVFSFLSVFTHGKAFCIWCRIQKKSYSARWKDRQSCSW